MDLCARACERMDLASRRPQRSIDAFKILGRPGHLGRLFSDLRSIDTPQNFGTACRSRCKSDTSHHFRAHTRNGCAHLCPTGQDEFLRTGMLPKHLGQSLRKIEKRSSHSHLLANRSESMLAANSREGSSFRNEHSVGLLVKIAFAA